MKTCAPCRPVRPKKVDANEVSLVANPMRWYSITCVIRNVVPRHNVSTRPACMPARLPFLIEVSAQCIVALDVTRISVLIPATKTGRWNPSGGQWPPNGLLTTRSKK